MPLGSHWLGGAGVVSAQGAVFAGVFALLAALCWLSARLARRQPPPAAAPAPAPEPAAAAQNEAAAATLRVLGKVLPYVTVVIALFAPLAAGVYLVTSAGWSLAERRVFLRGQARAGGE